MVYAFIILGALSRLVPHPANFAPIAALALFGGVNLRRRDAILVPLISMLVSDYFISGFYGSVMFYVYGSFLLIGLLGMLVRNRKSPSVILSASFVASILFFIITNFGVWTQGWYGPGFTGLIACYTAAIPFFRNTVLGDIFYTGLFFGGYELALNLNRRLRYLILKTGKRA
jgi:hypothetical protein